VKAVVTGAASGIGRAVAERFTADGTARGTECELLLVDLAEAALEDVADSLRGRGAKVGVAVADLSRPDVGELVEAAAAEHLGGVDALISNAGICKPATLAELDLATYEQTFAINTRACWLLAKALRPRLVDSRGAIVATASISAREPTPPFGAYSASKAALVMLIEQLAYEWGPDGIRCNCVSPGTVHTEMTDATYSHPTRREERAQSIPVRRVATPDQIAAAIAFLAGPDAAYVTGVDLLVDGGLHTVLMPAVRGADTNQRGEDS
jgi:glucose 1-dehydrogenase